MDTGKKNFYPKLILLLLGCFLVFSGWSAYRAVHHGSRVTDPDYYSKGLRYNSTLVEKRAASVLGWSIKAELRDSILEVRLLDKDRVPVSGATAILFLYPADGTAPKHLPLTETGDGRYRLPLESGYQREIRGRLEFERNGARLTHQLLLNL